MRTLCAFANDFENIGGGYVVIGQDCVDGEALNSDKIVARRYRNRRIGDFLKELDLTEGRCTGIPKMRAAMEKNGSPPSSSQRTRDGPISWWNCRFTHSYRG